MNISCIILRGAISNGKNSHNIITDRKIKRHRHIGKGNVKVGAEIGIMQPQAKELLKLPEATRDKKKFSLRAFEGKWYY